MPCGARTRLFALCSHNVLPMHHRHNKPRLRLIRCYSWRVYSTLSTFASLCLYNTTLFSPKTCKVCKEKSGQQWPPHLSSTYLSSTFSSRTKKKPTTYCCQLLVWLILSYALISSTLATRTSPHWHASSVAMCLNSCLMRYTVLSSIAQYTPVSTAL